MFKKFTAVILILLLALNTAACAADPEKKRYEAEFLTLFDTVTRIVGYDDSKQAFSDQAQLIHDCLEEYHQLYDIYHDYEGINNIKTINEQAGIAPVKVDRRIIDLLLYAREAYELTGGKVNVAFGSVLKLWHDHRTQGIDDPDHATLPPVAQLKEAAGHTDMDKVIIDEENSTVFLEDPEMSLDVGAIAKGYATEQVCKIATENGFDSGLISVGGNVRAIGVRGDGVKWKVGIQNPIDEDGENISQVALTDAALVTSGIYERFYIVDGKQYHHIIDPETLFPSEYFASVTILCENSGMADALSTAIFNMSFEEGKALLERLNNTEALWVFTDGTVKSSSGFENYIES